MADYYPVSLNIQGKRCVVIGGGEVALRKVKALLEHGASVQVVSPALCPELNQLATSRAIDVLHKEYEPGDLKDAFIAIAATTENDTNQKVADEARQKKILVNVADSRQQSDFIIPSYFRRGDLTIAVSTAGGSPALARKIRTGVEENFGEEYATLTSLVEEVRSQLKRRGITATGDDWQKALDLDLLVRLLQTGQREKAKATLLSNFGDIESSK